MSSSNPILKASCWKCREVFTVLVRPTDHNQPSRMVIKLVPCPYCAASCQLTLREDQVFSEVVSRGAGDTGVQRLTWAEQNEKERAMTVFATTEPPANPGSSPAGESQPG
jgi:hypothetical protein